MALAVGALMTSATTAELGFSSAPSALVHEGHSLPLS